MVGSSSTTRMVWDHGSSTSRPWSSRRHGQFDDELGSPGGVVLDPDVAVVILDNGPDDGQAQPGALPAWC